MGARSVFKRVRRMIAYRITVALFVLLCPAIVRGAYVVYEFNGAFEHFSFAGPVVPVGSSFSGLFSIAEGAERVDESFNGGIRSFYSPAMVSLSVNGHTIEATNARVEIQDAVTLFADHLVLLAGTEVDAPFSGPLIGHELRTFSLHLDGWRETFSSSDFPLTLDLESFQGGSINILSGPLDQTLRSGSLRGGLENLMEFTIAGPRICNTPTCAVPEPDAAVLGVLCFLSFAALYWVRARIAFLAGTSRASAADSLGDLVRCFAAHSRE
ncbi:MAG: hypothetical protein DCC68_00665 [Planctomycetota bacterium]|nr:MAG: hypothetical protein DCC68_00665 [Planctomycetota bacterium]